MILVSGLPRSGNNFVREHILRCIRRTRPYVHEAVLIWHGTETPPRMETPLRFVIPVRNPRCRELSLRNNAMPPNWPEAECRTRVFAAIVAANAPVKLLSYEAFVSDPEGVGRDLIQWLGYAWVPVPTDGPTDAQRPYMGPVFDGNAKYSTPNL